MNRAQLEHVIRASATISEDDEIIVIGSQSLLGQFPDAPADLCVSVEADVYPKNRPERADLIDGSIGEGSLFHDTFGYYAQGVDETTAVLPHGWKERLIAVQGERMRGVRGLCLEVHDLVISKLVAGRGKDLTFARDAARHGLVAKSTLVARLQDTELDGALRTIVAGRIARAFADSV